MIRRATLVSLLAAAAACGEVNTNKLADAPAGTDGATHDGATVDAAPTHGTVTVHVLDPKGTGADATGVQVVFIDSAGTQTMPTNGSGLVTADVHADASVTAVMAVAAGFQIQTVTKVEPGDTVLIGAVPVVTTPLTTFDITAPLDNTAIGTTYAAFGPCTATPAQFAVPVTAGPPPKVAPLTITENPSCAQSPTTIVIHEFNANGSIGFLVVPAETLAAAPTVTALPNTGYTSNTTLGGSYANLDPSVTSVAMGRFAPDAFGFTDVAPTATPSGGAATASTFGPTLAGTVVVQSTLSGSNGTEVVRELTPGTATAYAFDAPTRLIPFVGVPSFDLTTGVIHTPISSTGTSGLAPDLFRAQAIYTRSTTNNGVATTTQFNWLVYGPTPGDVTLPTIPEAVGAIMPLATDTITLVSAVSLELDTIAGYAKARLDPIGSEAQVNLATNPGATLVRFSAASVSLSKPTPN